MRFRQRQLSQALAISFFLHFFVLLLIYFYFGQFSFQFPKEEVITIDLRGSDWKIADILPPKVEERPDKARHLGIYDSKVLEETVSSESVRAPGRPKSRGGEGMEKLKGEVSNIFESDKFTEVVPDKLGAGLEAGKVSEDFYPEYKLGLNTRLNVLNHPDVGYFVMLKRVFKLAWDPKGVLIKRWLQGEPLPETIKVVLEVVIDQSGVVKELSVADPSGMADYDDEALRVVRVSSPFISPPEKILSGERLLHLTWAFEVYR